MISNSFKFRILDGLIQIHDNGPKEIYVGICANLEQIILEQEDYCSDLPEVLETWLKEQFVLWPHFSGCLAYPVPSPNYKISAANYYLDAENIWVGKYGKMRYNLLDFLIEQARK